MPAAIDNGGNLYPGILSPHVQGADTLWPVHFVRRDGHQVDIHLVHVDRNLADCLGSVGVEDHAALATELPDFRDRLYYTNFVVGGHDRHQDGLVIHDALEFFEIDQAVFLDRHVGDAVAVLLQPLASVEHGLVLGDGRDDVVAFFPVHLGHALDSEVVAFSRARSEDDFFGSRAN